MRSESLETHSVLIFLVAELVPYSPSSFDFCLEVSQFSSPPNVPFFFFFFFFSSCQILGSLFFMVAIHTRLTCSVFFLLSIYAFFRISDQFWPPFFPRLLSCIRFPFHLLELSLLRALGDVSTFQGEEVMVLRGL